MDSTLKESTTVEESGSGSGKPSHGHSEGSSGHSEVRRPESRDRGGFLEQYKPEQGKWTRRGTFIGTGLLATWAAWSVYDQLRGSEGSGAQLLITPGIPLLVVVILGVLCWRVSFVSRKSGDFMIATEGEMKKVSWSSKREVIGSTKVVIVFTVLMALLLFAVDLVFQSLFQWIGVLKV